MAWSVELTDEFQTWFNTLPLSEQLSISTKIDILERHGPGLGRPNVDTLVGSSIPNLKELRVQHAGDPYRILFAFDPRRTAILLIGGRKGPKGWYRSVIHRAEKIYEQYLEELRKEGLI
jgi:hypothetical protein